jgi:hypothetical protein
MLLIFLFCHPEILSCKFCMLLTRDVITQVLLGGQGSWCKGIQGNLHRNQSKKLSDMFVPPLITFSTMQTQSNYLPQTILTPATAFHLKYTIRQHCRSSVKYFSSNAVFYLHAGLRTLVQSMNSSSPNLLASFQSYRAPAQLRHISQCSRITTSS